MKKTPDHVIKTEVNSYCSDSACYQLQELHMLSLCYLPEKLWVAIMKKIFP